MQSEERGKGRGKERCFLCENQNRLFPTHNSPLLFKLKKEGKGKTTSTTTIPLLYSRYTIECIVYIEYIYRDVLYFVMNCNYSLFIIKLFSASFYSYLIEPIVLIPLVWRFKLNAKFSF
jgi:hypothetical protein